LAHIVLFHSILGLRPVEREIASVFEADGHSVALPDLFDGQTAEDYDDAFAMKRGVGQEAIMARATAAVAEAPDDAVLSGVSFGADLVGEFWDARPKMKGALLYAGCASWMSPRRTDLKVSAHIARPDPFDDEAYFADWAEEADGVPLELHRYDGVGHYFLDRTLPDFGEEAAALCLERSRAFLKQI
jgi:dienelactone hydrolase